MISVKKLSWCIFVVIAITILASSCNNSDAKPHEILVNTLPMRDTNERDFQNRLSSLKVSTGVYIVYTYHALPCPDRDGIHFIGNSGELPIFVTGGYNAQYLHVIDGRLYYTQDHCYIYNPVDKSATVFLENTTALCIDGSNMAYLQGDDLYYSSTDKRNSVRIAQKCELLAFFNGEIFYRIANTFYRYSIADLGSSVITSLDELVRHFGVYREGIYYIKSNSLYYMDWAGISYEILNAPILCEYTVDATKIYATSLVRDQIDGCDTYVLDRQSKQIIQQYSHIGGASSMHCNDQGLIYHSTYRSGYTHWSYFDFETETEYPLQFSRGD